MTGKKYVIISLSLIAFILILFTLLVVIVDPYFHYHQPLDGLTYTLNNERYQNDGIVKHFNYDAIITGTSMTENFKTSEFDQLFNVNSIKVSLSGAMFKEINELLITATKSNKNIKMILRCLDLYKLNVPKDKLAYESDQYPTYLYDKNTINDIKYVLNKDIIVYSITNIINTIKHEKSTSFDDYNTWYQYYQFSKDEVDSVYKRLEKSNKESITQDDYQTIKENIEQNVLSLIYENSDIEFYLFYPPYSIYYWDNENQLGTLEKQLDTIEYVTKLLVEYPNIHLYSFLDEYSIITNLNNYKDERHYSEKINTLILNKMNKNENILTKDNYQKKFKELRKFYLNFNYEELFK